MAPGLSLACSTGPRRPDAPHFLQSLQCLLQRFAARPLRLAQFRLLADHKLVDLGRKPPQLRRLSTKLR